jgi:hypothetical protein
VGGRRGRGGRAAYAGAAGRLRRRTDESYSLAWSAHSSGAMYDGVPICSHIASRPGATSTANPKSISLSSASSASSS